MNAILLLAALASPAPDNLSSARIFSDAPLVAQSYSCTPRKTCKQIRSCDEALYYLKNCAWGGRLDGDHDGAPCEALCGSNN